jgi:predicted HicB family RNase H-like nuclease
MPETHRLSIRTSAELRSQVKKLAVAHGKSVNQFVIELIEADLASRSNAAGQQRARRANV